MGAQAWGLGVSPPGALSGSSGEEPRKIPLCFWQGEGKTDFETEQSSS